ncbi:MAG: TonB-dependent receptor [Paraprevotella sp.]|nr:TonB-dependent receptor [Paraprevotella sp.]
MKRAIAVWLILLLVYPVICAQNAITATVTDKETHEPLIGAVIRLKDDSIHSVTSDANGLFTLKASVGDTAYVSYLGYGTQPICLQQGKVYGLSPQTRQLNDVVVTATESKSLTSASEIGQHAMEHLQPSSFTDLLELLPGGQARDPSLASPNTIHLREVPVSDGNYNTSSLGTAFIVDGARISTNANMQHLSGAVDNTAVSRDFTNAGVDMRAISTDDIQKVEIVRGIPSVEYGDLTSGLVKIQRKKGGHDLSARFKADMDTKLFYLAKGMEWEKRRITLNVSADYMDNRADPRNILETYSRMTFSARTSKQWQLDGYTVELDVNADYGGSFDKDKVDPDQNYGNVDKFSQEYNRMATDISFELSNKHQQSWFKTFSVKTTVSYEKDQTPRTRQVQMDSEKPAATSTQDGESDAVLIYPYRYAASQSADGEPLSIYAKAEAEFTVPQLKKYSLSLLAGTDWQMDKNYGAGQVFDPYHPLYPNSYSRPRPYYDIPASHIGGVYAEATAGIPFGDFRLDLQAGIRGTDLFNLPASYAMHGKVYADPRVNAGITLPAFHVSGKDMIIRFTGGIGQHTKTPTLDQLFPENMYLDLVELNYYHAIREYRRIYLRTYIVDQANRQLRPARNLKWEAAVDASWRGNRFTLTYFEENMNSGFRTMDIYAPYAYKQYDASGVDANALTGPPDIATLPYQEKKELLAHNITSNGSRTFKQGVELTMSTVRVPVVNTRLTVTGAWFKSEYHNSQDIMNRPSYTVDGQRINYEGIYRDDDGYIREMYNTNFTFDTDVPKLKLGISLSLQCMWLTAEQSMPKQKTPDRYMDADGVIRPFTESDAQDPVLQLLIRPYNPAQAERQTEPFSMNVNLKATKKRLNDKIMVALFVNKLWDAHPDYVRNGYQVRRYVNPYFGVELNFKL